MNAYGAFFKALVIRHCVKLAFDTASYRINAKLAGALEGAWIPRSLTTRSFPSRATPPSILPAGFHLRAHFETRILPVYELVPAKGRPPESPKLLRSSRSPGDPPPSPSDRGKHSSAREAIGITKLEDLLVTNACAIKMQSLARMISFKPPRKSMAAPSSITPALPALRHQAPHLGAAHFQLQPIFPMQRSSQRLRKTARHQARPQRGSPRSARHRLHLALPLPTGAEQRFILARINLLRGTRARIATASDRAHPSSDSPSWRWPTPSFGTPIPAARYRPTSSTALHAMQKMTPDQQREQVDLMEQSLLADRFKLKVHFETREMPVYSLVAGKVGPHLTNSPTLRFGPRSADGQWSTRQA